jgi:hypothetical protein
MSVRYQRRISLGKGLGVNLSKSGMSLSKRTPFGSIGTSGYSIRTGIPGLFFRKYKPRGRKSSGMKEIAIIIAVVMAIAAVSAFLFYVLKAVVLMTIHYSVLFFKWARQLIANQKAKKDAEALKHRKDVDFVRFNFAAFPEKWKTSKTYFKDRLAKNKQFIKKGDEIATVHNGEEEATLLAETEGVITFYKYPDTRLKKGSYLFMIDRRI